MGAEHQASACSQRRMKTSVIAGKNILDLNRLMLPFRQNSEQLHVSEENGNYGCVSVALVPDGKYKNKTPQVRTPDTFLVHFVSSAVCLRRKTTDLLLQKGKWL